MPGDWEVKKVRSPRRRGLTESQIVDAAMAIVDAEGLDALTMRAVAAALGTGAASLYAYIGSKDDLVNLLIDRAIGEMRFEGEPDPVRWREQFREAALEMRAVWGRHGDLARASFGRIPVGENVLVGGEWMSAVLRVGGLSDRVIGMAMDLFALYVGAVSYEDSLEAGQGDVEEFQAFIAQLRGYYAALPVDRFPNLQSLAGALTAEEDRFRFGVDVIIAGLEAVDRADRRPEPSS
jgi:AcrR family transcriptional regulator